MERVDNVTPTSIVQLFLTPYIEFSKMFGNIDHRLLDCACGNMYQRVILEDRFKEVFCVDKKDTLLPHFFNVNLECDSLPWFDKYFDVVFSFETIEHLDEEKQDNFVLELLRVGKLVVIGSISTDGPNYIDSNLIFKKSTNSNPFHKKEFSSTEWKEKFDVFGAKYCHLTNEYKILPGLDGAAGVSNYAIIGEIV